MGLGWFSSIVATPGGSHWWEKTARPIFTPGMIVAVDERLASGEVLEIRELPGLQIEEPHPA